MATENPIPQRLQQEEFKFCLLKKQTKKPFEPKWQENGYSFADPKLLQHIGKSNNYGIICGPGRLGILDIDELSIVKKLNEILPETFTVETGSGKQHRYFLVQLNTPKIILIKDSAHYGELQGPGSQCVGPGSIHPDTKNPYKVIKDVGIAELSQAAIDKLRELYTDKLSEEQVKTTPNWKMYGKSSIDFPISLLLPKMGKLKKSGSELYGVHPVHGSTTGMNFFINPAKNLWHCFRCNSGGDALALLAVLNGDCDCKDFSLGGKKLRGEDFKKSIEIAKRDYGLILENKSLAELEKLHQDIFRGQKSLTAEEKERIEAEKLIERVAKAYAGAREGMTDGEVRGEIEHFLKKGKIKAAIYLLAIHLLTKYRLITLEDTQEIFFYNEGVYYGKADRVLSAHAEHILTDLGGSHFISEALAHIKRSTYKKRDDLLEPVLKVCLQNGILNLETMQLEPHTPDIVFFNKLPISFISTADCPLIKKFLTEVLPTNDDILTVQELFGYCLYKEYLIHKAIMFVGGGSNGKSTLIKILKHFLGKENCAAVPLHQIEGDKFAVASLFGKLANMFADLPAKALKDSSLFKMLTGEDNIPAEKKFKDKFFFQNYAKMIFSANQIPKTPDESDAFFRRWIILQFPNQFTGGNDDKKLIYRLTTDAEMSGLLNYAIAGLKRLLERGDFTSARSIEEMRELYMRQSDSVMSFIMDCLEISITNHIGKKELYSRYTEYCRHKIYPIVPENTFHQELHKKIRVEDYRPAVKDPVTNNFIRVNCWRGIKLIQNRLDNHDSLDINPSSSPGSQGSQGNSDNNNLGAWINSDEEPDFEREN